MDGTISNRCPQCGRFRSLNPQHMKFPHCAKQKAAYEESLAKWDKKMKPLIDAIRDSQRITAEDLAIMVY